jgi:hypothetical protein
VALFGRCAFACNNHAYPFDTGDTVLTLQCMPTKEAAQLINTAAAAAVASFKTSKQIIPP